MLYDISKSVFTKLKQLAKLDWKKETNMDKSNPFYIDDITVPTIKSPTMALKFNDDASMCILLIIAITNHTKIHLRIAQLTHHNSIHSGFETNDTLSQM